MPNKQATMEELVSHIFIMGRLMRDKMHKHGIGAGQCTLMEFETLKYVKDAGKPHMRDVAKTFHVTPPAATLMIDGLVKANLLARVLDPNDRRSVRVAITPKGKQLLERGLTKKVKEMKKTFGVLTPSERAQFIAIIRKIIKNNS
jgi:DNA-binding MarR family transcriptional regulator